MWMDIATFWLNVVLDLYLPWEWLIEGVAWEILHNARIHIGKMVEGYHIQWLHEVLKPNETYQSHTKVYIFTAKNK